MSNKTLHICTTCPTPHYDNCHMCFGFGVYMKYGEMVPISASKACDYGRYIDWKPCPECRSGITGVPTLKKESTNETQRCFVNPGYSGLDSVVMRAGQLTGLED